MDHDRDHGSAARWLNFVKGAKRPFLVLATKPPDTITCYPSVESLTEQTFFFFSRFMCMCLVQLDTKFGHA